MTKSVFRTIKNENERMHFTVNYFAIPMFDLRVFKVADKMISGYNGGYWEYVTINDKVGFMQLGRDPEESQSVMNPFTGQFEVTTAKLVGMIVTSYAMLWTIQSTKSESTQKFLASRFETLRDEILSYCKENDQMSVWYTIID